MKRWVEDLHSLQVARRFVADLRAHRLRLLGVAGLSLLLAAAQLLRPWPIKWVFDGALMPRGDVRFSAGTVVWTGVAAMVLIALLQALLQYVRDVALTDVGHAVTRGLRYRIFSHLTRLSPKYHATQKSGDLLVRLMGDAPMVTTMLVDSSVELATRSLIVVGTLGVMLFIDPPLTLGLLAGVPVLLLVIRWISNSIHVAIRKQRRKEGDLADYLHEAIAATETIQSLDGSEHVVRRFARSNRRTARAGVKANRLSARMSAWVESLLGVALAAALGFGSIRVIQDPTRLSPGDLLVFLSYVRSLIKPARSASKHGARIAKGTACGERILAVLDADELVSSPPDAPAAPLTPLELVFEDVGFVYADGTRALRGFSARFRRGELTALVGRSGVGKSTAAALAARLFDADEGRVVLDGVPLDRFDLSSLRKCVGLSLQRFDFFGESVRENLLVGRPDAEDEELWLALERAGAADFVRRQPGGLDAQLGSRGAGLSGGELSRLSLARTLLRRSSVLIVDEPFAGLDAAAARHVAETLNALAKERIVVVIAHDIERLDVYDRIVFMDSGREVDEGSHAELLRRQPSYREVVRALAELPA